VIILCAKSRIQVEACRGRTVKAMERQVVRRRRIVGNSNVNAATPMLSFCGRDLETNLVVTAEKGYSGPRDTSDRKMGAREVH